MIANAVVAKHLVQHPNGHLAPPDRAMLAGSALLFVGGLMNLQWQSARRVSWVRWTTILAVGALAAAGGLIPGVVTVALEAVLVGTKATLSWRRFRLTDIGRTLITG